MGLSFRLECITIIRLSNHPSEIEMPRQTLTEKFTIADESLMLGSMVEQAMLNAIDSLKRRDIVGASRRVYSDDYVMKKSVMRLKIVA